MTLEEKRVYLLLKAVIFHYHGLDHLEKLDLEGSAKRMDGLVKLRGGDKVEVSRRQAAKFKDMMSL